MQIMQRRSEQKPKSEKAAHEQINDVVDIHTSVTAGKSRESRHSRRAIASFGDCGTKLSTQLHDDPQPSVLRSPVNDNYADLKRHLEVASWRARVLELVSTEH